MIGINGLGVEFGSKPLFSDASFVINEKERVCLVGKNGAGKSTLLKIIANKQKPTYGNISKPEDIEIGYLPQVMILSDSKTLIDETRTAFENIKKLQNEIDQINNEIAIREDYESKEYLSLIERSSLLSEKLSIIGGTNYEAEMERTLIGLGFERSDFNRPTSEFSGGWRMRIELAKILLQHPDLLLLDEPTNHLDIESIRWLEQYLINHSDSAVLLVSHDRAFINNVTNRTIDITCGKIVDYKVKYDDYIRLRAERREQQIRAYENQQKEIADIKSFIETFRYKPTKAQQVQSRIKQLAKIVPIEIDEIDNSSLRLKFNPPERSGDFPLICEDLRKDYGKHTVFQNVNITIKRGEKIAFVGKNGEGKSTLVKCIMNQIDYYGTLKIGHNVQIGYYAQNQAQLLDEELTVFETIDNVATGDVRTKIRDILGAFMFGGEASDKKVKVLSGGERSRLAMIKLLLEPVNMLILDEPTNHLDMRTKDVLKEAIRDFKGTVIIVSHDREFLDGLVEKVYEFCKGKIIEHIGGIYDFLQKKQISSFEEYETKLNTKNTISNSQNQKPTIKDSKLSYEEQKQLKGKIKKLEKQVSDCEQEISEIESAIKIIEERMSTPEGANDMNLINKHTSLSSQVEKVMKQWEELAGELEKTLSY